VLIDTAKTVTPARNQDTSASSGGLDVSSSAACCVSGVQMTLTKHFNSKSHLTTHFNAISRAKRRGQVETDTFGETSLSRFFPPISATRRQASEWAFDTEVREATAPVHVVRSGLSI
jgi:hypothetical protein